MQIFSKPRDISSKGASVQHKYTVQKSFHRKVLRISLSFSSCYKYSLSCNNVTSVSNVKVCNFLISSQSVCEVILTHVNVFHVTTYAIVRHWNEISLYEPIILPTPVMHVKKVSTYASISRGVDCLRFTLSDASSTADTGPIDVLKSYDEIEGSTLLLLPMLKKNVVVFIYFLYLTSVFNFRMAFIFCQLGLVFYYK